MTFGTYAAVVAALNATQDDNNLMSRPDGKHMGADKRKARIARRKSYWQRQNYNTGVAADTAISGFARRRTDGRRIQ